ETAVHPDFTDLQNYRPPTGRAALRAAPGARLADVSKEEIAEAVWDRLQPSDRDIIVFFIGIVLLLLIEGIVALLVSRSLVGNLILIALGIGVGWTLEKYLQYRREHVG